jgi:hypothetical protein
MPFASDGTYTPPNGAENAFAGKTIASATWNSIFTDLSSALTTLGQAWAQHTGFLSFSKIGVNFNAANSDNQIAISVPSGFTRYTVNAVLISNASHSLTTATFGLFTAAAGGGTALIPAGTAITVSATTDNTVNNFQQNASGNVGIVSLVQANTPNLFFRVGTAEGAAATADVIISIRPLP